MNCVDLLQCCLFVRGDEFPPSKFVLIHPTRRRSSETIERSYISHYISPSIFLGSAYSDSLLFLFMSHFFFAASWDCCALPPIKSPLMIWTRRVRTHPIFYFTFALPITTQPKWPKFSVYAPSSLGWIDLLSRRFVALSGMTVCNRTSFRFILSAYLILTR